MAWSCAPRCFSIPPLMHAIASAALPNMQDVQRQSLSNLAWASATLVFQHDPFLDAISSAALALSTQFGMVESGSMANALWVVEDEKVFWAWAERMLPERHRERQFRGHDRKATGAGGDAEGASSSSTAHVVAEDELQKQGHIFVARESSGDGATFPRAGDRVCVSYVGKIVTSDMIFDAAKDFSFTVGTGTVIAGWDQAITSMSLGEESQFVVHHSRAYGGHGVPAMRPIPPFANLLFRVHLVGIQRQGQVRIGHPVDGATALILDLASDEENRGRNKSQQVPPCTKVTVQSSQPSSRHQSVSALAHSVVHLSVEAWLQQLDERGALLRYRQALEGICDSVERLVGLYGVAQPDGSTALAPEFFADVGVERLVDRRIFRQWFEQR